MHCFFVLAGASFVVVSWTLEGEKAYMGESHAHTTVEISNRKLYVRFLYYPQQLFTFFDGNFHYDSRMCQEHGAYLVWSIWLELPNGLGYFYGCSNETTTYIGVTTLVPQDPLRVRRQVKKWGNCLRSNTPSAKGNANLTDFRWQLFRHSPSFLLQKQVPRRPRASGAD